MAIATLTSKGQITIPLSVREKLGLKAKADERLDFVLTGEGALLLRPNRVPFEELMGALKRSRRRAVTVRQMDKGIEKAIRERWARKNRRRAA